jgi:polyferredoxin
MSYGDLLLALWVGIAGVMATVVAYLLKWASEVENRSGAAIVLFLLVMMVAMIGAATYYLIAPGPARLTQALWLASGVMSVSAFPVVALVVRDLRQRLDGRPPQPIKPRARRLFVTSILALAVLNELFMGWAFLLASGYPASRFLGLGLQAILLGITSPWFLGPMALEMALTTVLLRRTVPRAFGALLATQTALMALSPTMFPAAAQPAILLAGGGLMIGVVVYVMELLYRERQVMEVGLRYLLGLMGAYALMMGGTFLWWVQGSTLLLAISIVAEMVLFFELVLVPGRWKDGEPSPWLTRPHWTFALLSLIFVAELFMGALFDLVLEPSVYSGVLGSVVFPPGSLSGMVQALQGTFWFVANITGSTWFLAMMGLEMGALVVFKLRQTRHWETRIRLGLMMACYGAFTVFYPSLYYSLVLPGAPAGSSLPVLGWSMGIGSAPLAPVAFGVVGASYAITGTLCALFGRRVICSTFCSAPLMYQGTTIDVLKTYNRSSPLARKFLSSRFSTAYSVTTGVVMGSLVVASSLSYLDSVGRLALRWAGADPTVFLFALYFGVLWYVMFITIPYTGNYNCVTMGWCYTGTIAQAFHRIGFFRLKVRDRSVCWKCTTLDCARSCPVGLVDMPGHFRQRGEFRSSKCCGTGSCVEACPHNNLYIYDFRHWLSERFRGSVSSPAPPKSPPNISRNPNPGSGISAMSR